jgi:hypothetical protein
MDIAAHYSAERRMVGRASAMSGLDNRFGIVIEGHQRVRGASGRLQ